MKAIIITLGVILQMQCSQPVNFVESPSNITQPVGSVAEFTCQHQSLNAVINWLVNGSSASRFPDATQNNNGNVGTLTIPSVPEYDGTVIMCEAFYRRNGSLLFEETLPAILTVLSIESVDTLENTTTTVTTADFLTVPSPPVLIVTMEERYVYLCNHSETINIFWRVNGSRLRVDIFPVGFVSEDIEFTGGGRVSTLTIGSRLDHNATTIQCSAQLSDGSTETTPSVLFFMQGPLQSVDHLERRNTAVIVWEPPLSLNLTNVDPDIVYCVEVYNITCGGRELLVSDCDVMETSYTSDVLQSGYIYEYTVTPRSNVEGAQNGTSKTVTEQFMDLQLSTKSHYFSRDSIEELKTKIHLNNKYQNQTYVIDAACYSLSLSPLDGFEEESLPMSTITVRNGSSVVLKVSLPYRRLWNYTVLAYDCEVHSLMETNELSTHDIQNISVTSPQPGEVRVTGDFIDGSTATGLLTIVISTSEIFYNLIERGSDQLHIEGSIQGVVGGEHSISFFVVEENGLPFNRTASTPKVVSVENGNAVKQPSIEYSLQSTSTGVCITCTFQDSSATDCVAVVHQRISQLNSSGLMNIESSHKLTRSGDTASGCIEGVNMEDDQVGVVGGRRLSPLITGTKDRSSSCEGCTVGIVLGVLVFIVLAVVVMVVSLIVVKKRKRTKSPDVERSGLSAPLSSDHVNQPENEATINNLYESITVTNHEGSRAELGESALEMLISTPPLPMRQRENGVYSNSSDSPENTSETSLTGPNVLGANDQLYDPQPTTDMQHQSNEVLIQETTNPSLGPEETTPTNIQSSPDPTYAEPQMTGSLRAPVQTPSNEHQSLQSPPPVPPRTEDREVLLENPEGKPYAMLTMYNEIQPHSRGSTTAAMGVEPDTSTDENYFSETALVSVDRSYQATYCCSPASLQPSQGAQPLIFNSSVQQGTYYKSKKDWENNTTPSITDDRFCPDTYGSEYVLPIEETCRPLRSSLVHGRLPMLGRLGLLMVKLLEVQNCGKCT